MSFFKDLAEICPSGQITLSIKIQPDQKLCMVAAYNPEPGKGDSVSPLPPMHFQGTAPEFDDRLIEALKTPIRQTVDFFANKKAYEEAQTVAQQKVKEDRAKLSTQKTEKSAKQKLFDAKMAKVKDLETAGKIGEAIGQLPKATEFPEYKEKIEARTKELRKKHGGLSLFDPQPSAEAEAGEPQEEEQEEDQDPEDPEELENPEDPDEEE